MKVWMLLIASFVVLVLSSEPIDALSIRKNQPRVPNNILLSREDVVKTGLMGLMTGLLIMPDNARGFDNKVSTIYDGRPKRRGTKPADLGVLKRTDLAGEEYIGLKPCGPAPNCFVSTDSVDDDPDHSIPAWVWPKEYSKDKAFIELVSAIESYEPGQSNVDGGGFKIITTDSKNGYIYVQFESLKNGYIDDLELAMIDGLGDRTVQVRSSSRIGYLDYGVNAKRVNYIANALREKGWDAVGVDYKTHQNYAIQNELV